MATFGFILAGYVGVGFSYLHDVTGNQWRGPLALSCLFPLINLAVLPFVPESPRFLLTKGETERAWQIIRDLHSREDDPSHDFATAEFFQIRKQLEIDNTLDSSWLALVIRPSYRKRLLIAVAVMFFSFSAGPLVISSKFGIFHTCLEIPAD